MALLCFFVQGQRRQAPVTVLCDVDNPLCGPRGAAAVFGPQKGADPDMVQLLDAGLAHLAAVLRRDTGRDVLDMPGGGAAGGFGAGAAALLNARLRPGVEMLLDAADFPRLAADADLIITGEGRLDSQSLGGKAVIGVARRARELRVPCAALAGAVDVSALPRAYELGLTAAFPVNPLPLPFEQVRVSCRENLSAAVENLIRFYCSVAR